MNNKRIVQKWFIELKKMGIKKNGFQEISKDFIKNDFKLMISIYLFTKHSQFIFSISFVFNFPKKKVICTYCIKKIITKF